MVMLLLYPFLSLQSQDVNRMKRPVKLLYDQRILVDKDVTLFANVFLPNANKEKKYPVILTITPYVIDKVFDRGYFFAQNGYVFVAVDARGRGNSEGDFLPFIHDGQDGAKVVDWIAEQEWCNGKVGMMGGSYTGMNQWMTAKYKPKALKTIAPTSPVCPGIDFPMLKNIMYAYDNQWLAFVSGKTLNPNLFASSYWLSVFSELYLNYIPFKNLSEVSGIQHPAFEEWLKHPNYDDFYKSFIPSDKELHSMNIPIMCIAGYFDGDQVGSLYYYRRFLDHARNDNLNNFYCVLGPYDHGGTRKPVQKLGGLSFSDNVLYDFNEVHKQWFDYILKKGEKPDFFNDNFNYYVMGKGEWESAESIDNWSNGEMLFYLTQDKELPVSSAFGPHQMGVSLPKKDNSIAFEYDPLDLSDYEILKKEAENPNYLVSRVFLNYSQGVFFSSKPLKQDVQVNGYPEVELYIKTNVRDMDMQYKLYELNTAGEYIYLAEGMIRARYRESNEHPSFLNFNEPTKLNMPSIFAFSRLLKKGSRLLLYIGPLNTFAFQKNYNSEKEVSEQGKEDAKIASIELLLKSNDIHSVLKLPIKEE